MPLSARDRGRYARHLLLPEIGLSGQERLAETRVRFVAGASREATDVARTYLARAGVRVDEVDHDHDHDRVLVAVGSERAVVELAGEPGLVHAAAALAGALGAVEAMKLALGLGTPVAQPFEHLCLSVVADAREPAREPKTEDA